jgi:hypothetical protein
VFSIILNGGPGACLSLNLFPALHLNLPWFSAAVISEFTTLLLIWCRSRLSSFSAAPNTFLSAGIFSMYWTI